MIQKLLVTFCIALYAVGVPVLEINDTHVFNPDWTPHVRIHEVWQLLSNSMLGVLCLWWLWIEQKLVRSAIVSLIVTGGFLLAFMIKDFYGGSMKYLDGSEKTVFDINIGVVGFGLAVLLLGVAIALEVRQQGRNAKQSVAQTV